MTRTILATPHFHLTVDDARGLAHLVRTAEPAETVPEDGGLALEQALLSLDATALGILVDVRLAALRDDKALARLGPSVSRIFVSFRRASVLVATAIGELQVSRLMRESGGTPATARVFREEAAAESFALGG